MRGKSQGESSTKEKATTQEAAATQQSTKQINSRGLSQTDHIHDPFDKRKYIFIAVYKPRDTIYTDQTGKFLHTSIQYHNYQMVIHKIDGNSTWIEPMKNKTQGGMIKARHKSLKRIKLQGIVPLHQILDNEIYEAYKEEILATKMPYQLVSPDDHLPNIAERAI